MIFIYIYTNIIKHVVYYTFNISWRYIPYYIPLRYHLIDLEHTWTYHYTSNIPFIYFYLPFSFAFNKPFTFFPSACANVYKREEFWIQDSRLWEKLLESKRWLTWGPGWQSRPGIQESLQSLQIFGKCLRVCVCMCLPPFCWFYAYACVYVYVFIHI